MCTGNHVAKRGSCMASNISRDSWSVFACVPGQCAVVAWLPLATTVHSIQYAHYRVYWRLDQRSPLDLVRRGTSRQATPNATARPQRVLAIGQVHRQQRALRNRKSERVLARTNIREYPVLGLAHTTGPCEKIARHPRFKSKTHVRKMKISIQKVTTPKITKVSRSP